MGRLTCKDCIHHDVCLIVEISSSEEDHYTQFGCKDMLAADTLVEQGRLIGWRKTAEEKPDSTRHLIVADGEIISHYGYYLKPEDKWFTNWKCEEEISAPIFWADMPEPPKESLHSDCGAKMESEVAEWLYQVISIHQKQLED